MYILVICGSPDPPDISKSAIAASAFQSQPLYLYLYIKIDASLNAITKVLGSDSKSLGENFMLYNYIARINQIIYNN